MPKEHTLCSYSQICLNLCTVKIHCRRNARSDRRWNMCRKMKGGVEGGRWQDQSVGETSVGESCGNYNHHLYVSPQFKPKLPTCTCIICSRGKVETSSLVRLSKVLSLFLCGPSPWPLEPSMWERVCEGLWEWENRREVVGWVWELPDLTDTETHHGDTVTYSGTPNDFPTVTFSYKNP